MCDSQSAVEPVCLTQTSKRYVPPAEPLVFQVAVALVPYPCRIDHDPPDGWIQNSYWGLGHPVAAPVRVTAVPTVWGETGLNARVTAEHGARVGSVAGGVGEMCASQLAVEPDCLAQMSNT